MTQLILGLLHAVADIGRAIWQIVTGKKRSGFVARGIIRAPQAVVWDILTRTDITYLSTGLHVRTSPLAGHDDILVSEMNVAGRPLPAIAFRYDGIEAPNSMRVRYLPEHSGAVAFGSDDFVQIDLSPVDGGTAVSYRREMTHTSLASRISAPLGVRSALHMTRAQAEHEAGITPHRQPVWQQLLWSVAAFLSFAWLLDWRTALLVMTIIAIHELGHALAMLWYGLGISFVSFVPFLGGVAAPRRYYDSEWQRCVVALMGVGFSLPFSLLAGWAAGAVGDANLGAAAILSLVINGINLVPFPALDGSIVVSTLLGKLHQRLSQAMTLVMFALFVAIGFYIQDAFVWAGVVLSFVSIVQVMSLRADDHLIKMRWVGSLAIALIYAGLVAAHVSAFLWASVATARAESAQLKACMTENGSTPAAMAACREKNRLWFMR